MSSDDFSRDYELVDRLVDEFAERYARGERPSIQEYCDRYPEVADLLRDLIPTIARIEQVKEGMEATEETPKRPQAPRLEQLGDFQILREIGRGGMGVVYEAEQVSLGRRVALKVLTDRLLRDPKQKRRFEREAKAAARLHHTNIVPVFGTGEAGGVPYYVMQFIQGMGVDAVVEEVARMTPGVGRAPTAGTTHPPLREASKIARSLMTGGLRATTGESPPPSESLDRTITQAAEEPHAALAVVSRPDSAGRQTDALGNSSSVNLPGQSGSGGKTKKLTYWQSVARIGVHVADALSYAHAQGVIHRDVKPSNLLLDLQGTVWVTDFGLAKAEGADNLTNTGDILGTLRYMPPEAFDGKADARGDLYALGLTLYELVALRPAFGERDRNRLIKQVTTADPEPLGRARPGVPRDLETVIQKAMDREPARRYASAAALRDDLQRFVDDEPITARRQSQWERTRRWARHHPWVAALLSCIVLILIGVTAASLSAATYFDSLATSKSKAADDERIARQDADRAMEREAEERVKAEEERGKAELATKAADDSRKQALVNLGKAEENFAKARAAVHKYFTAVSEEQLLKAPGLQGLRAELLQSALQFYQDFLKERSGDPTLRKELAEVYYKVGEICRELGQHQAADQSYSHARRQYEALATETPADADVQAGLAQSLWRTGDPERAIAIWERLARADDPRRQANLAEAYNARAVAARNPARDLEDHRRALAIRERRIKLLPDDAAANRDLAITLHNIAELVGSTRPAEAHTLDRRAEKLFERAQKLQPSDLVTSRWLARTLRNSNLTAQRIGLRDEAVRADRRRIEVLDRMANDNPDVPGLAADLAEAYTDLVWLLKVYKRLDAAEQVIQRGRERLGDGLDDDERFSKAVKFFSLEALLVAEAKGTQRPDAAANFARSAAAAVAALRRHCLNGWWEPNWLRTDRRCDRVRGRSDFQSLLNCVERLAKAEASANSGAAPEDKLSARLTILVGVEALAGSDSHSRAARRALAKARQNLGKAHLEAGGTEQAAAAFDAATAERRKLVDEAPKNGQLRIELAQNQIAAAGLFVNAGKLREAARVHEQGLSAMEEAVRIDPTNFPARSALSALLLEVAYCQGRVGLWKDAAHRYRRLFEVQIPSDFTLWYFYATALIETGDREGYRTLTELTAARLAADDGVDLLHLGRVLLVSPESAKRHPRALRRMADVPTISERDWKPWCQGLALIRLGEAAKGRPLLENVRNPAQKWPVIALAEHQLGKMDAARAALRQADLAAEHSVRGRLAENSLQVPEHFWPDWLLFQVLRREAHQTIYGRPPPESPYERLQKGATLLALGRTAEAEAEFAAAAVLRPNDSDFWLTRARLYAKQGRKIQAAADFVRAQNLMAGLDPRPWIETGRLLAELGDQENADAAFAKAARLAGGELNRFLESGWWAAGPYPDRLELPCPPEKMHDPSRPVAAVGEKRDLRWTPVSTELYTSSIGMDLTIHGPKEASFYLLAYVYAERDRTAVLMLGGESSRLWVNDRLAFDGSAAWKLGVGAAVRIPVSLRAGRNALLIKVRHSSGPLQCSCLFHDQPFQRAQDLADNGLWSDAADAQADFERRAPLDAWRDELRMHCLLAAGRNEEYRQVYARFLQRHDRPGSEDLPSQVLNACRLPPERNADRDRWARALENIVKRNLQSEEFHYWLGNAYFRAARFVEAEKSLRRAIAISDRCSFQPLLAATLHYLSRQAEAADLLRKIHERHDGLTKQALESASPWLPLFREDEMIFLFTVREAERLITGKERGPTANEAALSAKARKMWAQSNQADDFFATLTDLHPDVPRHWIDRGRRLGGLGRWEEATNVFAKAVERGDREPQVWKERGRAYAELGKWSEAAADFNKALDLAPTPSSPSPEFPWWSDRGGIDDVAVQWDEVYRVLTKLRPNDANLVARRAQYFAARGRWRDAEPFLERYMNLVPGDRFAPSLLAALRLLRGDVEGYRRICRRLLDRFASSTDPWVATDVAVTCLLAPNAVPDLTPVRRFVNRIQAGGGVPEIANRWRRLNDALLAYRAGDAAGAAKSTSPIEAAAQDDALNALESAITALAQDKMGQTTEARESLAQAQRFLVGKTPQPDRGWLYPIDRWQDIIRCRLLVREAESQVQAAPTAVAQVASSALDEAARRERSGRSEKVSTDFVLALVQLDNDRKAQAEVALTSVLTERRTISAEEPDNREYRSNLAAAYQALGQVRADLGRFADGANSLRQAAALRRELVAFDPKDVSFRAALAESIVAVGNASAKAERAADAVRAWVEGVALLAAIVDKDPQNTTAAAELAKAERTLGECYATYALWPEAADVLARAVRRPGMETDVVAWTRAAQALAAAGRSEELQTLAAEAVVRFSKSPNPKVALHLPALASLSPERFAASAELIRMAEKTAAENPREEWREQCVALCEYRAGRFEAVLHRLDAPTRRDGLRAKAILAMACKRLGRDADGRRWLAQSEDALQRRMKERFGGRPFAPLSEWWGAVDDLIPHREAHALIFGRPLPLNMHERLYRVRAYHRLEMREKADVESKAASAVDWTTHLFVRQEAGVSPRLRSR